MTRRLYMNLPIQNLNRSKEFFLKLGFTFNEQFSDETSTSMIVDEGIVFMLLEKDRFQSFVPHKEVVDTKTSCGAINAIQVGSKEEVNRLIDKAKDAGGVEYSDPQDHGFMYGRSFEDLDGNHWELFWMDPKYVPQS